MTSMHELKFRLADYTDDIKDNVTVLYDVTTQRTGRVGDG